MGLMARWVRGRQGPQGIQVLRASGSEWTGVGQDSLSGAEHGFGDLWLQEVVDLASSTGEQVVTRRRRQWVTDD